MEGIRAAGRASDRLMDTLMDNGHTTIPLVDIYEYIRYLGCQWVLDYTKQGDALIVACIFCIFVFCVNMYYINIFVSCQCIVQ